MVLHDLVLRDARSGFGAIHGITLRSCVQVFDESDAKGAATVLITTELGCEIVSQWLRVMRSS